MCFFVYGREAGAIQVLRAVLNRVEAVSRTWAAPTPARKAVAYHSPLAMPTASPPIAAVAAIV